MEKISTSQNYSSKTDTFNKKFISLALAIGITLIVCIIVTVVVIGLILANERVIEQQNVTYQVNSLNAKKDFKYEELPNISYSQYCPTDDILYYFPFYSWTITGTTNPIIETVGVNSIQFDNHHTVLQQQNGLRVIYKNAGGNIIFEELFTILLKHDSERKVIYETPTANLGRVVLEIELVPTFDSATITRRVFRNITNEIFTSTYDVDIGTNRFNICI